MAYGIRYQIAYYRKGGGKTSIDILEKDYSSTISNLVPDDNCLKIHFQGDVNNIYKPTLGTGATIRVRATPLSLDHLFTTDPQKYMVKVYNGDSEESSDAGDKLVWQGFINTGIYSESYSTPLSLLSLIVIECNDGMVLLEDIPYSQSIGGSVYAGFSTIGQAMQNIFSKLAIEFFTIRTATDLEYDGHTNIFTTITVNNENYYDENGTPMSCRSVLESIFAGIGGLVMTFKGSIIYLVDPIHLHSSFSASKSYNTHPTFGSDESVIGFGGYLDISAGEIEWDETGQTKDIVQPFNSIEINYDPYTFTQGGYDFNAEGNVSGTDTFGIVTDNDITFNQYTDLSMAGWEINGVCAFEGVKQTAPTEEDPEYFIRQTSDGSGTFEYTFPFSNIKQSDTIMLEVSMDVYVNTKHSINIIDPAEEGTEISSLYLSNIQVKVGSKWYTNTVVSYGTWGDSEQSCSILVRELDALMTPARTYIHKTWFGVGVDQYAAEDESVVSDKWVTAFLYVPIREANAPGVSLVNGSVTIIIPKAKDASVVTGVTNILIKNINVKVVDTKKRPILNDGIMFKGSVDSAVYVKKSPLNIKLTNGIGPYGCSKGAFSSSEAPVAGENITGMSRSDSVEHKTSELLLQSLLSQYGSPKYKLNGKLNVKPYIDVYINVLELLFHLIKDTNHLSTKAFMIVSGTYNDREENMEVEMIELTATREDIS